MKDRNKINIKVNQPKDFIEQDGKMYIFLKERIIRDDNGDIIGVETQWQ